MGQACSTPAPQRRAGRRKSRAPVTNQGTKNTVENDSDSRRSSAPEEHTTNQPLDGVISSLRVPGGSLRPCAATTEHHHASSTDDNDAEVNVEDAQEDAPTNPLDVGTLLMKLPDNGSGSETKLTLTKGRQKSPQQQQQQQQMLTVQPLKINSGSSEPNLLDPGDMLMSPNSTSGLSGWSLASSEEDSRSGSGTNNEGQTDLRGALLGLLSSNPSSCTASQSDYKNSTRDGSTNSGKTPDLSRLDSGFQSIERMVLESLSDTKAAHGRATHLRRGGSELNGASLVGRLPPLPRRRH